MINDERADVLARATRRLRDEQDAALAGASLGDMVPAVGDPTWSRIVIDVRRARRRTRVIIVAIALQVAVGLGGVGYAAVTGRLAALVRGPSVPAAEAEPSARRLTRAASTRAQTPAAPAAVDPAILAPPSLQQEPPVAVSHPAAPAVQHRRLARRAGETAAVVPVPAAPGVAAGASVGASLGASLSDGLYREAHRLHFVRRDFAAALDAWDRFLAAGSGPLVLEARYNRAIALAHLGRRREAISALTPFAEGEVAAYRQREARALIERFRSDE